MVKMEATFLEQVNMIGSWLIWKSMQYPEASAIICTTILIPPVFATM
jgi:hypothetical protein